MYKLYKYITSILFLVVICNAVSGQIFKPVKWKFDIQKISGNEYKLIYTANVEKGWTVYSQYTSSDGPVPTEIVYESKDGIEILGKATERGSKKEGMDSYFGVNVIKYLSDSPFIIEQKIKVKDPSKPIAGYLIFMACDHEKCLPPSDVDFSFKIPNDGKDAVTIPISGAKESVTTNPNDSKPSGNVTNENKTVASIIDTTFVVDGSTLASNKTNSTIKSMNVAHLGPKIVGDTIDQKIEKLTTSYANPKSNCGGSTEEKSGLFWTFLFGFIGGLFALLTPCVFPMLPITISFFTKDSKRPGWLNGLIYGISIIAIYVTLGLLITILLGPEALNRLSTNWIANTLFFIIFIIFAFSFFGYYEIALPSSWTNNSDRMADKGGLIGIFFMAFTLALVSFSCTGPIIGTAIVQASTKGEYLGPFIVMLGFAIALALPFGIFAAFPSWLKSLPKSGGWMQTIKVTLGFIELALAFKFLSTADLTNNWGFLKYELFIGLWVLIFIGLALYLFGYIKFPLDSPLKKLSFPRIGFGILAVSTVIYLLSGFKNNIKTNEYNSLSLLAGIAPSVAYNMLKKKPQVDAAIKAKYPSYTMCVNNIECFKNYYEGLQYANEVNKPIFIDFTGHGCVNCRKTEQDIWVDDRIRKILKDSVVLISLYVDDDKKLSPVYISKNSGSKLRNVGNQWADFQIVNFEQNSQPLYVFANPNQEIISKPRGYKPDVEEYLEYLRCNLAARSR
jgi:thiol:disulfide interchange protein DsbD